jgi:hypothetical protein
MIGRPLCSLVVLVVALISVCASLPPGLVWRTQEGGKAVEYDIEPAQSARQKLKAHILSLLPLDNEL